VLLKLLEGFSAGGPVFSGAVPVISSLEEIKRRIWTIKNHRTASLAACLMTALVVVALAFTVCTRATASRETAAPWQKTVGSFEGGGPIYHRLPAGHWAIRLKQGSRDEQSEARANLQAMGKDAVSFFIQSLQKQDLPDQWRAYAASALGKIGSPASNAIPALLQMTNGNFTAASRAALRKIRGEPIDGLDGLIRALNDPISD
jgi:hypothetical protein